MIWILLGCSDGSRSDTALESIQERLVIPELSFSIPEYSSQIQNMLGNGIPDAEEAKQAYLSWRSNGDAFCPGQGYQLQGIIEPCTASTGYIFSGMATIMGATTELSFPDAFEVGADCYIINPTSQRFVGAGDLFYESEGGGVSGSITNRIVGTWQSPTHDGWLGKENSLWLTQTISWTTADSWNLMLDGAYHLEETSLRFHQLNIGPECTGGQGRVDIRDPNGYWLQLHLKDDCSGCAEAFYNNESKGEACLELFDIAHLEYQEQQVY